MSAPNRTHEKQAVDMIVQLDNTRPSLAVAVAVTGAAIAHALLDVAQAIREGHVR